MSRTDPSGTTSLGRVGRYLFADIRSSDREPTGSPPILCTARSVGWARWRPTPWRPASPAPTRSCMPPSRSSLRHGRHDGCRRCDRRPDRAPWRPGPCATAVVGAEALPIVRPPARLLRSRVRGYPPGVVDYSGPETVPRGPIDTVMATHGDGDFLGPHHDNGYPDGDVDRREMTFVYSFHRGLLSVAHPPRATGRDEPVGPVRGLSLRYQRFRPPLGPLGPVDRIRSRTARRPAR